LLTSCNTAIAILVTVNTAATDITDHDVQWTDSDSDDDTVNASSSSTASDSESDTEVLNSQDAAVDELLDDDVDMSHLLRTAVVVKADTGNALAAVLDSLDERPDVQVSYPCASNQCCSC
jgi:hypothetical protein